VLKRRKILVGLGAGALTAAAGWGVWGRKAWHSAEPNTSGERAVSYAAESPHGLLRAEIVLEGSSGGTPRWRVQHRGRPVLEPSPLGLTLADGRQLGASVRIIGQKVTRLNETWRPPYGIASEYAGECNELAVQLLDTASNVTFDILLRAYDAGIALRYLLRTIPDGETLHLSGENTHFKFPAQTHLYASRDEGEYQRVSPRQLAPIPHPPLTASSDAGPFADVPVTAVLANGLTIVLTESDRVHYPRLMLRSSQDADTLVTHLMRYPGRADGWSGPGETPAEESFALSSPFATPWRVLLVGEQPGAVIENAGLIATLARRSELSDTSWIRPGRAFRSFRDNTTAGGLACVDFAEQRRLEYIEFDAHWYGDGTDPSDATVPVAGLDIRKVIEYARQKNIGVIVYVDRVPAMRQLDDIVRTYQQWGVAGIKFGFMWEGRQSDNDWLYETIRKCGEHRLLVCVHDNARPAGLERTLPNYVSLEGVRGNEQFPTARHNVTLPFTANVAGPIDYTICYAHERSQTTNAHQLAMAVVYYCPLTFLYWYDRPDKYSQGKWPELSWFDECPTVWDETRVLDGSIGEYIVIARRRGERWFVGAMTNEQARTITVPLRFMGEGRWEAVIYADGTPAPFARETPVIINRRPVTPEQSLETALAPSGGQAISLLRIA
jgi:alpha-glucosidase